MYITHVHVYDTYTCTHGSILSIQYIVHVFCMGASSVVRAVFIIQQSLLHGAILMLCAHSVLTAHDHNTEQSWRAAFTHVHVHVSKCTNIYIYMYMYHNLSLDLFF